VHASRRDRALGGVFLRCALRAVGRIANRLPQAFQDVLVRRTDFLERDGDVGQLPTGEFALRKDRAAHVS
jgi:hypothetical protein